MTNDVVFVLPGTVSNGGVHAVFEISDKLLEAGYEISIVVPRRSLLRPRNTLVGAVQWTAPRSLLPAVEKFAPEREIDFSWFPLRTPVVLADTPLWRSIPGARVVVATSYRTAEELMRSPKFRGSCVYFVQGYEVWSGRRRRVDRTWREFDKIIATSEKLRRLAKDRFGHPDAALAEYGVDTTTFVPADRPRRSGPPTIGFMWDERPFKGGPDVVRMLESLRDKAEFQVRAFGLASKGPPGVPFAGPLYGQDLADFYRSLDVFVSASRSESGPMTVPEAMASGVAVVSTDVGSVRLWSDGGEACRVVPPADDDALRGAVLDLLADERERERSGKRAREAILPYSWERTATRFASALREFGLLETASRPR